MERATQQVANGLESRIRLKPHLWYHFYPYWDASTSLPLSDRRMDSLSHVALAHNLPVSAATTTPRAATGVIPAAVLGALSPDVDIFLLPRGWDRYMTVHESGTHSVIGPRARLRSVGRRSRARSMASPAGKCRHARHPRGYRRRQPPLVRSFFRRYDSPVLAPRRYSRFSATSVPLRWRTRGSPSRASREPSRSGGGRCEPI